MIINSRRKIFMQTRKVSTLALGILPGAVLVASVTGIQVQAQVTGQWQFTESPATGHAH